MTRTGENRGWSGGLKARKALGGTERGEGLEKSCNQWGWYCVYVYGDATGSMRHGWELLWSPSRVDRPLRRHASGPLPLPCRGCCRFPSRPGSGRQGRWKPPSMERSQQRESNTENGESSRSRDEFLMREHNDRQKESRRSIDGRRDGALQFVSFSQFSFFLQTTYPYVCT